MKYRRLGSSGLAVSEVSFGAGPLSGLMAGEVRDEQSQTVGRALRLDVNWFDTAATYGDGNSERALGSSLRACGAAPDVHVATKVRLQPEQLDDIPAAVEASFAASLRRLGRQKVTLLQLHNSVTRRRGDLPTSVAARDVLGERGVVAAFEKLRGRGQVDHFGFTGLGDQASLRALVRSGAFASAQVPLNLLTLVPSPDRGAASVDVDYETFVDVCAAGQVGVIAIRLFAGGALVGQAPSAHTYRTKFFTLELFQRDLRRARQVASLLPPHLSLAEATIRFVLGKPGVSTALVGFANPRQVEEAVAHAARGPLAREWIERIRACPPLP